MYCVCWSIPSYVCVGRYHLVLCVMCNNILFSKVKWEPSLYKSFLCCGSSIEITVLHVVVKIHILPVAGHHRVDVQQLDANGVTSPSPYTTFGIHTEKGGLGHKHTTYCDKSRFSLQLLNHSKQLVLNHWFIVSTWFRSHVLWQARGVLSDVEARGGINILLTAAPLCAAYAKVLPSP